MKNLIKVLVFIFSAIIFASVFVMCGTPDVPVYKGSHGSGDSIGDNGGFKIKAVTPSQEYYESFLAEEFQSDLIDTQNLNMIDNNVQNIYLNFNGGIVQKGFSKNKSPLICGNKIEIPSAKLNDEMISRIITEMQNYFDGRLNPIKILGTPSTSGPYSTMFIGGSYKDLGCSSDELIAGISPFDKGNINKYDIGFIFSDDISCVDDLMKTVKTTISNSIGIADLSDEIPSLDPVLEEDLPGIKEIQSMARLLWRIGTDNVMDISSIKNEIVSILPKGMSVPQGFDKIISASIGASTSNGDNTYQTSSGSGGDILSNLMGLFNNSSLDPNTIAAASTLAGHPEIGLAASMLLPLLQGTTTPSGSGDNNSADAQNHIPDYSKVLGIDNIDNIVDLITNYKGHLNFINNNYSGNTLEALKAMLIVGYSQVFRNNFIK